MVGGKADPGDLNVPKGMSLGCPAKTSMPDLTMGLVPALLLLGHVFGIVLGTSLFGVFLKDGEDSLLEATFPGDSLGEEDDFCSWSLLLLLGDFELSDDVDDDKDSVSLTLTVTGASVTLISAEDDLDLEPLRWFCCWKSFRSPDFVEVFESEDLWWWWWP